MRALGHLVPCWLYDIDERHFASLDSEWSGSECLTVTTKSSVLLAAKSAHFLSVQFLRSHVQGEEGLLLLCQTLAENAPELRVLDCGETPTFGEAPLRSLAKALESLSHLEQIRLSVSRVSKTTFCLLFDAIATHLLSLKALSISFKFVHQDIFPIERKYDDLGFDELERMCAMLARLLNAKLQSLEVKFWTEDSVRPFVQTLAQHGQRLRVLGVTCADAHSNDMIALCDDALCRMPRLHVLNLQLDVAGFSHLIDHFASRNACPVRNLSVRLTHRASRDLISKFFSVIARTQIYVLHFEFRSPIKTMTKPVLDSQMIQLLHESKLLESGFIGRMSFIADRTYPLKLDQRISEALVRNVHRHFRCKQLCSTLIAIRRQRRSLAGIPSDIVTLMAQNLWETRNEASWDAKKEEALQSESSCVVA